MLALLLVCFASIDRAEALCTPAAPVNGVPVNCTTNTTDQQGGGVGYGTAADTGNTYNVLSGVQLIGTNTALVLNDGTVHNDGVIDGVAIGIHSSVLNVTANTGTISGGVSAINASNGTATINNNVGGNITGTAAAADAIFGGGGTVNVTNSGNITAGIGGRGVQGFAMTVVNTATGTISSSGLGNAIAGTSLGSSNVVAVTNSGHILSPMGNAISSASFSTVVDNSSTGVISGAGGVSANSLTVTNAGSILGTAQGIGSVGLLNLSNSGTISAGANAVQNASAARGTTITNSGTISGAIGIKTTSVTAGANITNSGTIAAIGGPVGTAIRLTAADDTLTLKPTSVIIGKIDMGNGNDTINLELGASTVARGLSSIALSAGAAVTALRAQLLNFDTTTGDVLNIIGNAFSGAGQPTVTE